jgi:hypothetical protein
MKSWLSSLILFSILIFSFNSKAAWILNPDPNASKGLFCTSELFDKTKRPTVWTYGKDVFGICYNKPLPKGPKIVLKELNELVVKFDGTATSLYFDGEIDITPRHIRIHPDRIEIEEFLTLESKSPRLLTRVISCKPEAPCELEKPQCTIKHPLNVDKKVQTLSEQLAATPDENKAKAILWRSYFLGGPHKADGEAIVLEAMMGNKAATLLVLANVGIDKEVAEAQEILKGRLKKLTKICSQ